MNKIRMTKFEIRKIRGWFVLLALVLTGGTSFAQTNNNIPGPADYTAFSKFVTDRNIFDPNRVPRSPTTGRHTTTRTRTRSASAPTITLVGTMAYEKGDFAFFSSTEAEQKRVLPAHEKIAGYVVSDILPAGVTLMDTNKNEFHMKIGDALRQDNGGWHLEGAVATSAANSTSATAESSSTQSEHSPSPALEGNDILKRLMEKRAQEEK